MENIETSTSATPAPADAQPSDAQPTDTNQSADARPTQNAAEQKPPYYNFVENPAQMYFAEKWAEQLANFQKYRDHKTGFSNLDNIQPLYPGLYVIGAISSLGKTTFIHQMADQIASEKKPVLYFSYEQSALELYSKALARRMNQQYQKDKTSKRFSSIDIRRGLADGTQELADQIAAYTADVENYLNVVECNFDCPVETIQEITKKYIKAAEENNLPAPTIIIDYLQVISPSTINGKAITEQRASVDHIVKSLKSFQKSNNLTVICICSLNRMNYMLPVDFESFKESGGIEYTADVVWGMQLSILSKPEFQHIRDPRTGKTHEASIAEQREMIKDAKCQEIRDIQLVTLKNRYGASSYTVDFEYEPRYDTFRMPPPPAAPAWVKESWLYKAEQVVGKEEPLRIE